MGCFNDPAWRAREDSTRTEFVCGGVGGWHQLPISSSLGLDQQDLTQLKPSLKTFRLVLRKEISWNILSLKNVKYITLLRNLTLNLKSLKLISAEKIKDMKDEAKRQIDVGFQCTECNNIFEEKHCLKTHIKSAHSKTISCDICNEIFNESR